MTFARALTLTTKHLKISGLLLASLLAIATMVRSALAQGDDARMADQAAIRAAQARIIEMDSAIGRVDRREARHRFDSSLKSRVEKLHRRYGLSDIQKKKLVLAGRIDVERFFDRLEELENKLSIRPRDRVEQLKAFNELTALNLVESQDLFGEHSLFSKVLANTLTKEQAARFQVLEREIAVQHHHATLKWVLDTWDQTLGLSAEQHQRLEVLLKQETRPPRRFGGADYFGVLLQVSRLPEAKLKPILRDDQWTKLRPQIAEARRQEPELKREGYVPDNDVAAAPVRTNDISATRENEQG
jgi:hypothetical protein